MAGINLTVAHEANPTDETQWRQYTAKTGASCFRGSIALYDISNDVVLPADETDAGAADPANMIPIGVFRETLKSAAAGAKVGVTHWGGSMDFKAVSPVAADVRKPVWASIAVDPATVTISTPTNQVGIVGYIEEILVTGTAGMVRVDTRLGGTLLAAAEQA